MKKIIRLTETDLHNIINESVKKILKESDTGNFDDFYGGEEVNQQSQQQEIINQLLQLGVRDVTNVYNEVENNSYDYEAGEPIDTVAPEIAKQFLSKSGEARLMKRGYIYQWFIEFGDRVFCSRHNFNNEDQAADNCDKYTSIIEKTGEKCNAYVNVIDFDFNTGKYGTDTVLTYEDFGDGDAFWND